MLAWSVPYSCDSTFLVVLQQFPVDNTVLLLPQMHSRHHFMPTPSLSCTLRCRFLLLFFSKASVFLSSPWPRSLSHHSTTNFSALFPLTCWPSTSFLPTSPNFLPIIVPPHLLLLRLNVWSSFHSIYPEFLVSSILSVSSLLLASVLFSPPPGQRLVFCVVWW